MSVTASFLEPYIKSKVRHKLYEETCEQAEEIDLHASGKFPEDLIGERRPAEADQIKEYRKKIFVAKTKPVFTKIYNSLQKINRSPDFAILFDDEAPARIPDAEKLKNYIHTAIPQFGSLSAWFWNVGFRYYLIDANAWVLTLPMSFETPDNEYYKPIPTMTEWTNADGAPQNWASSTDAYNSVLKLHLTGWVTNDGGVLKGPVS